MIKQMDRLGFEQTRNNYFSLKPLSTFFLTIIVLSLYLYFVLNSHLSQWNWGATPHSFFSCLRQLYLVL